MQQFKRLSFRPVVSKVRTIYTFPNISVAKFGPKASISVLYHCAGKRERGPTKATMPPRRGGKKLDAGAKPLPFCLLWYFYIREPSPTIAQP